MSIFEMRKTEVKGKIIEVPFHITTKKQYNSKSQAATVIYREVQADESLVTKHRRAAFLNRVAVELHLGEAGGSTYYYNKQRAERGEDEYGCNKNTNKKAQLRKKAANKKAKTTVEECAIERWQVVMKDTKALVKSFSTRTEAQTFNKAQKANGKNVQWIDGNKKVA